LFSILIVYNILFNKYALFFESINKCKCYREFWLAVNKFLCGLFIDLFFFKRVSFFAYGSSMVQAMIPKCVHCGHHQLWFVFCLFKYKRYSAIFSFLCVYLLRIALLLHRLRFFVQESFINNPEWWLFTYLHFPPPL
jgi:hypothetical protein